MTRHKHHATPADLPASGPDHMGGLTADELRSLLVHVRIAHHVPGRVRLKLAMAALLDARRFAGGAKQVLRAIGQLPGIRSVTVNRAARSCVVEYDEAMIPPAWWETFISGGTEDAAAALAAINRALTADV